MERLTASAALHGVSIRWGFERQITNLKTKSNEIVNMSALCQRESEGDLKQISIQQQLPCAALEIH